MTKKKTGRVRTQMEMSRALPRRWNSRRTKRTRSHLHAPSVHFTKCLNSTQNRPRCTPGPEVWCSLPSTKIRSELPHAPEVYREVSPYFNGVDKYIHRNGDADTPRVLTSVNGVFFPQARTTNLSLDNAQAENRASSPAGRELMEVSLDQHLKSTFF